jgi:hypothetical protein
MVIAIHTPDGDPWTYDQENDAYGMAEQAAEELTTLLRTIDGRCKATLDV